MSARPWQRDPLAWALGLTLVCGLLSTGYLAFDIGRPFGGFVEEYLPSSADRLQVDSNTPLSWPNVEPLRLINASLLAIDDQPYRQDQAGAYAAAAARGEPNVLVTVERAGVVETLAIPLRRFTLTDYLDLKLPIIVTNVALWLLAVIVYHGNRTDPLNRSASGLFGILALALWTPFVSIFWDHNPVVWIMNAVTNLAWPMLGAAIVEFACRFPRPMQATVLWLPPLARGLGATLGLTWAGCRIWIFVFGWTPAVAALDGLAFGLSMSGLLAVALVFFVGRLVWSWATERERAVVRGLAIVTIGLGLASLPIVLFLLDMAGLPTAIILKGLDLRYLLLAIPASYAFVILRYRTFRTAHPMYLVVVILGMSALLASLGNWGVRQLLNLPDRSLSESFVPVFVVCLVASTFWATQTSWQGLFSRLLQWERTSYAAARSFGDRLGGRLDPDALPGIISHALRVELKLDRVAVWRWAEAELTLAGQAGEWPEIPASLTPDRSVTVATALMPQRPIRLQSGGPVNGPWVDALRAAGAEVVVFLAGAQGPLGMLALGKKWDEEVFDERDLEIVGLIAQQSALVWTTSQQMSELRRVPTLLSEAQTRERFRIAQDLHDTVQQRLGGVQLLLDTCVDMVRVDPAQAVDLLERCTMETERTAQIVSRIRDNLAPPEPERPLDVALAAVAESFAQRTGITPQVRLSSTLGVRLSPVAHHELALVVQQALDNIAEHARATRVSVVLEDPGDLVSILIADDGQGFSEERRRAARAEGSFGLQSMQARVLALGGELRVESSVGGGTRVAGWAPL